MAPDLRPTRPFFALAEDVSFPSVESAPTSGAGEAGSWLRSVNDLPYVVLKIYVLGKRLEPSTERAEKRRRTLVVLVEFESLSSLESRSPDGSAEVDAVSSTGSSFFSPVACDFKSTVSGSTEEDPD